MLHSAERVILSLNSGSSSLKFGLYRVDAAQVTPLLSGAAEWVDGQRGTLHAKDAHDQSILSDVAVNDVNDTIVRIASLIDDAGVPSPEAIGHRVVHGGPHLLNHGVIDDTVLTKLKAASAFAPLHAASALTVIRSAQQHFSGLPQVACFDTAFHADMPDVAQTLPIPKAFRADGIRRYGFHGISCESILHQFADAIPPRLIICHLGNGASVTAVKDGRSIDTSMGLTPSGGVIMGTRSGDLDPGVLLYLIREKHYDAAILENLIDYRSGLLGISGISGDIRRLHEESRTCADARLALQMFCYSVRKQVAGMMAALGGVDSIVFTGGIGEHDSGGRATVCEGLAWFGVGLDGSQKHSADGIISTAASAIIVRVMPSQEDEQIARHAARLGF
jgi:acetate kinase